MSQFTLLVIQIVFGIVVFVLANASTIPQIITLRKTRNTSGISLISYIICNIDNIFWIVWVFGLYFNSMEMYKGDTLRLYQISLLILCFGYLFGCTLVAYLLFIKIVHLKKAKQYNVTELQLSKILLDIDKKKYFVDNKWNSFKKYFGTILFMLIDFIVSFTIVSILYVYAFIQPISESKEWVWVVVLSFISAGIWEVVSWPQLIKSIREKDMTGISLFWCIFMVLNVVVNFVYDFALAFGSGGFNYDMLFIIIFSAMAPNIGILVLKIINIHKAKKAGMSEMEYTKNILIPLVNKKKQEKTKQKSAK